MKTNRKLAVSLAAGTLVSAATLYFAFRNVPLAELLAYFRSVDYWTVFPATAAIVAAFVCRALRWRSILAPAGKVGFRDAFHPLMIGFAANCVYPGRVGEIARPLILKAKNGVPFTTGLATVGVERLMDLVSIVLLFGLALYETDLGAGEETRFAGYTIDGSVMIDAGRGMLLLAGLIVSGVLLVSWRRFRDTVAALSARSTGALFFLAPRKREKAGKRISGFLSEIMENVASGFAMIRSPRRVGECLLYSVLIWWFTVYSYYAVARGSPGIDLSMLEIAAVVVMICFAIALPSVPGYWGLWEAGGVFALGLFGVGRKEAAGYTLVSHAIQIFPVVLIGLFSAWATGVDFGRLSRGKEARIVGDADSGEGRARQGENPQERV